MEEERRKRVPKEISSVSHPTRQAILKQLKKSGKTTLELERELKESRYNLYHHLEVLKKQGIIEEKKEGKIKVYKIRKGVSPIVLEVNKLPEEKKEKFRKLLNEMLKMWQEDEIKKIDSISEVMIIPTEKRERKKGKEIPL
ncbi:MAG: winged helix-turn-helix domain-containing protein [Candidatus Heimdallarchaeaceae archaeon]